MFIFQKAIRWTTRYKGYKSCLVGAKTNYGQYKDFHSTVRNSNQNNDEANKINDFHKASMVRNSNQNNDEANKIYEDFHKLKASTVRNSNQNNDEANKIYEDSHKASTVKNSNQNNVEANKIYDDFHKHKASTVRNSNQNNDEANKIYEDFHKHKASSVRNSNQNNDEANEISNQDPYASGYEIIFRNPNIKYFRMIPRVMMYQLGAIGAVMYPVTTKYMAETVPQSTFYSGIGAGVALGMVCIVSSYYSQKVIGELAVNKDSRTLKISRLTFFGRRTADFYSIDSIVPPMDDSRLINVEDIYQLYVTRENGSKNVYFYSMKYGNILDKELFCDTLGLPSDY